MDYGDNTLGVAVSDPLGTFALGLETIRRARENDLQSTFARLEALVTQYAPVTTFVLGYPKNMNNSEGPRCAKTRKFQAQLERRFPTIPVVLCDERLSTAGARHAMGQRVGNTPLKKIVDEVAAALILQGYMEAKVKEKQKEETIVIVDEHGNTLTYDLLAGKTLENGVQYFAAEADGELFFFVRVSADENEEMVLEQVHESEVDALLALFAAEFEELGIDVQ